MWPKQTYGEMTKFFGPIGTNLKYITVPEKYPLKLYNGSEKLQKLYVNNRIAEPVIRVLNKVLEHYGSDKINNSGMDLFFGCYNPRRMRGGSNWSTHAWGAALDFDAAYNPLRWKKDRARLARQFYDKWWEIWEDEGAVSLGRVKDFDWMHVQFARI